MYEVGEGRGHLVAPDLHGILADGISRQVELFD